LLNEIRRIALRATEFAKAQCNTIRNKLLKIGAQVMVSVRRVSVSLASGYPYQEIFLRAFRNLHKASKTLTQVVLLRLINRLKYNPWEIRAR